MRSTRLPTAAPWWSTRQGVWPSCSLAARRLPLRHRPIPSPGLHRQARPEAAPQGFLRLHVPWVEITFILVSPTSAVLIREHIGER